MGAYNFGGAFRSGELNKYAGNIRGCPKGYKRLKMGKDPDALNFCYTKDFQHPVNFHGFFKADICKLAEPCPPQFAQIFTYGNKNGHGECEFYCVRPKALIGYANPNILRPPFYKERS